MAGNGWIRPNRLSPPTPPVISRAENNCIMEEQRKKVDDASKDERQRICESYQRRGGLLPKLQNKIAEKSMARKKGTSSGDTATTPSQPPRRSLRNSSGQSNLSSLSSAKSSQPLLDDAPTPNNICFDEDVMNNNNKKPSRLSNITEEQGEEEDQIGAGGCDSPMPSMASLRSRSPSAQCCVGFLCLRNNNVFLPSNDSMIHKYTRCIECTLTAHVQCAEQFHFQKPTKDGPLRDTSLSISARKRLKAVPDKEKESVMFCLKCRVSMEARQAKKKSTKKKRSAKKGDKDLDKSAPKKKKPLVTLPEAIKLELRRVAGFYCRHLIFQGKAAKAEDCKTNTGKLFYGDAAQKKKGVIDMLVDGDEPFKDLYEEYDTDTGTERILKPWLCGPNSISHYIPGVHFTAESLAIVGDHRVSGRTVWDNSAETVKVGKKAISFIPEIDICEHDKITYKITGLKSGVNYRQFYDAVNSHVVSWQKEETTRLKEGRLVQNEEWSMPENIPDQDVDASSDDDSTKWFQHFLPFFLFGPTRSGVSYSSLWRRSQADNMDKDGKKAMGRAAMKDAESGKAAKRKLEQDAENERREKKRRDDEEMQQFQRSYSLATVAQAQDEFEAMKYNSEMDRITRLIDSETINREFNLKRQDRCKDNPVKYQELEDKIDRSDKLIEEYNEQLRNLKRAEESAGAHVKSFYGTASSHQRCVGSVNEAKNDDNGDSI